MLFKTSLYLIFLFNFFNSLYLLLARVFKFAVRKNLKSASGKILYVISRPSKQEPLYFFGGLYAYFF